MGEFIRDLDKPKGVNPKFDKLHDYEHIITYCYTGTRSSIATDLAHEFGWQHVKSITGGYDEYCQHINNVDL